jgi:RNA polymerase sigma-70 factor (ECF subfamily)
MVAFEELVARNRNRVFARAMCLMRNEDAAIEVSQQAWVHGWQRLKQFYGKGSFATWMVRIVTNLCCDELRKQKRLPLQSSVEQLDEEFGGVEKLMPLVWPSASERLEREELRRRIDLALKQLPDGQRTTVILYEFEDLSYREIADQTSCSVGTVMSRLFYGRRKLARLLSALRSEARIRARAPDRRTSSGNQTMFSGHVRPT